MPRLTTFTCQKQNSRAILIIRVICNLKFFNRSCSQANYTSPEFSNQNVRIQRQSRNLTHNLVEYQQTQYICPQVHICTTPFLFNSHIQDRYKS